MSKVGIPVISYKNKTANFISKLGTAVTVVGVLMFGLGTSIGSETVVGIGSIFLLAGLADIGIVWLVMQKKNYDAIVNMVRENNLEPVIASNTKYALEIYKLAPGSRLEKYIKQLNPAAGEYIAKHRREFQ